MKVTLDFNLPDANVPQYKTRLYDILRQIAIQVNNLSDGLIIASYSAAAAPTTGKHSAGDFVKNNAPTELGVVTAKYVITGWICTASGTPGTWLQARVLTGN
jgi:hypothetical protein